MSDCLHCDINDLVEEQLKIEGTELVEVAAKIAESLADLILLAPAADQSKLMADVLASFGLMFVEKSEMVESAESSRH